MNRNAEQKVQKNGEVVSKASVANPFDNSTNRHKKRTMIAILSLSLCFLLATTFGLQAVFRDKVDNFANENQIVQNTQPRFMQDIYVNVKSETAKSIQDWKQQAQTRTISLLEQELMTKYDEQYFEKYFAFLDSNPEPQELLDYLFSGFGEYEKSVFGDSLSNFGISNQKVNNTNSLLRDFFIGVNIPAKDSIWLWEQVLVQLGYWGQAATDYGNHILSLATSGNSQQWTQLVAELIRTALAVSGALTGLILAVNALLAVIPVVGWIAIGIIAAAGTTIFLTYLINGIKGKGLKLGVDVKTGWFGIPTGVKFICE